MNSPKKLSAQEIYNSLTPCLPMDSLYQQFESFISAILSKIDSFKFTGNNKQDIKEFLKLELTSKPEYEDIISGNPENIGYTVLLTMMGISREQMKNIIAPNYQGLSSMTGKISEKKIFSSTTLYDTFTELLMSGHSDSELSKILTVMSSP